MTSRNPPETYVPPGLTDVVEVAPGAGHCLALRVSGLTDAVAVAAGWSHSLA